MIKYTNKYRIKNIDTHIFIICNDHIKRLKEIVALLNIKSIPKKIYEDIKVGKDNTFEKKLYIDNYEIIFYFIGKKDKCDLKVLYKIFGEIGVSMYSENKNIQISLVGTNENEIKNQVISYILGYYQFNDFKTNGQIKNKKDTFLYHPKKKFQKIVNDSIIEAGVQNELRSLINTPANILTSTTYYKHMKDNINKMGLTKTTIKVLNEADLKKKGCNLILGVNQGSKNKAMMVILEYKNNPVSNRTIALIGKGVMFDSGGYNIKGGNFSDMKNDMTGSAIVYGIFKLLEKNNVRGHFIGLLPLVENMVDSNSIRPGDILSAYNKKTVEIIDTDAEGRLIMADALAYSNNYKPYLCIDIATLTGQAAQIFGNKSTVIMGNNNKYIQKMIQAGLMNNEKIWELPMWEEYVSLTKSNIADLKNYSYESKASTIMAGAFLSQFIPEKAHWMHLDIAGVDMLTGNTHMRKYGATGEIFRSLLYFLQNIEKESYEK